MSGRAEQHSLRTALVRSVLAMLTIGVGLYLLLPQVAGLEATGVAIAQATWWVPLALVGLEAASLLAYGRLLDAFLQPAGVVIDRNLLVRIVLVGNALGRALPGGTGTAFAMIQTALHRRGHDTVVTTTAMWGAGLLSTAILSLLLPIGVGIGLASDHLGPVGVPATILAVLVVVIAALMPRLLRHPGRLVALARRAVVLVARGPLRRRLDPDRISSGLGQGLTAVHGLLTTPSLLRRASAWAAANWLLDVAVVAVLAVTVGAGTPASAVLVAYVAAQMAASIPLTPGGVGIVEAAMVASLVAAGAPVAAATATVLGWRLVSHWLPIPIGLALLPTVMGRANAGRT